jgi:fatty-acyl-CoA synthase
MFQTLRNEIVFAKSAIRTLNRVKNLYENPSFTGADAFEEIARQYPDNVAIYFEDRAITYREFDAEANRYARWAQSQGLKAGDTMALFMENRPEYLIAWYGLIKAGIAVALINTNLRDNALAHCLNISGASHVIVGSELAEAYASAADHLESPLTVWVEGGARQGDNDLNAALAEQSTDALPDNVREGIDFTHTALYIYTSGTTGLPKAANITHLRLLGMMASFSAATNAKPKDRIYVVLPLYHSAGGICAIGTALTTGGAIILRRKFSAREFWDDCVRYKATLFQYIGELCRYLHNTPPHPLERKHSLRLIIGNGLRPEIWTPFKKRFRIPNIIEFYGATEGNVALMNFDGKVGAVGRIPSWARNRSNVTIVRFDIEKEEPVRGPDGFCIRCEPGEVGEALGEILNDPERPTSRFDGYARKEETEKKVLRDVFTKGDAWFRTGDLMKQDEKGYFYFIDRIGDTYRWKGENVATSEVSEVLSVFDGVQEANVYGVQIPGTDGRAGMAALVANGELDLAAIKEHLNRQLPSYAHPIFLRLQKGGTDITGTFKQRKVDLVRQGFDPDLIGDPLYVLDPVSDTYLPLDAKLYERIITGEVRY